MEHGEKLPYIPNAFHTVVLIAFQTNFKKSCAVPERWAEISLAPKDTKKRGLYARAPYVWVFLLFEV